MSRVLNVANLSNERAELINEFQELCQTKKCHTIKIDNQSAVESTLVIGPSCFRLDFKNSNLVHEPYMPSYILFSKLSRPTNMKKKQNWFGVPDDTPITVDEIEKAVDCLIQYFENKRFEPVSETFQECSVCLEVTNLKTMCNHPLCTNCWKKIEKLNDKKQNCECEGYELARCPICRKEQTGI